MPDDVLRRIEALGYCGAEGGQPAFGDNSFTEDGVALAFTAQHIGDLRYCHHAQHWFVWTGAVWRREESRLAFDWARGVCREMALQAKEKHQPNISKAAFCGAVERFAQADRCFAVTQETWDRSPWLLGTPGGTVDLKTGTVKPAELDHYITKQTLCTPAPAGTPHPIWTAFLQAATGGDKDLQAFLQRLSGYFLTGDVTEEMLAFLYGEGGTGKGTFLGTIVAIMHDYAVSVPIEVFTANSRLNLEYYRAQMVGARLVTASETEQGATWAESQIKEMTGNEAPLSGRHPYGKPFTFRPQFKICLVGNHAPRLKGRSLAMERRLRIAPFKHKPEKPDVGLKENLRNEYPAILRWMIDGCNTWQKDRLGTCPGDRGRDRQLLRTAGCVRPVARGAVYSLTGAYSRPSLASCRSDYNAWAKTNSEETLRTNEFAELIDRKSEPKERHRANGVRLVKGVGLQIVPDHGRYAPDMARDG